MQSEKQQTARQPPRKSPKRLWKGKKVKKKKILMTTHPSFWSDSHDVLLGVKHFAALGDSLSVCWLATQKKRAAAMGYGGL